MKNKDISIYLRSQLIFYDVLMEIVNVFAFDYVMSGLDYPVWYSSLVMSLLLYSRYLHTFLILVIAWILFKIIVLQDSSVQKDLKKFTLAINAFALLLVLVYNLVSFYATETGKFQFMNVENLFFFVPAPFVLGMLVFFYVKIRATLKNELESQAQISCCKRVFAKHLIAYPMIYSLMALVSILVMINVVLSESIDTSSLFIAADYIFYVLYPIFNSVMYGLTKSTKKFMWAFLLKDKSYQEEEELLKILRETNLLKEQYYLDLISRTEEFDYISDIK